MRRSDAWMIAALCLVLSAAAGGAVDLTRGGAARGVDAVGMTVSDLNRSVAFFRDVLGFERVEEFEDQGRETELLTGVFGARTHTARMRLGGDLVELTEFLAPRGRPYPVDTRANDQWFQHVAIIVSDMDAAYRRLQAHGVAHASTGPQRLPDWNLNAGGIQAFYFRDPDGHFLEVLQFPPGKGDPKWHATGRLFLGIDHTAIVSTDTERSLGFYRDGLGLAVAGGAENHGVEQEHLNNVFGVRLRITTLRAPSKTRSGAAGVPGAADWTTGAHRSVRFRSRALADHRGDTWRRALRARCVRRLAGVPHCRQRAAGPALCTRAPRPRSRRARCPSRRALKRLPMRPSKPCRSRLSRPSTHKEQTDHDPRFFVLARGADPGRRPGAVG
jgi:catechol 2,3-dioxygenase-like lactoylglutathione lyase family enzyme